MTIPKWVEALDVELRAKESLLYTQARTYRHYKDRDIKAQYNIEASAYAKIRKMIVEAASRSERSAEEDLQQLVIGLKTLLLVNTVPTTFKQETGECVGVTKLPIPHEVLADVVRKYDR